MEKVKNTKKKGFVLIMVIILIVLISSAIFSVTMLNISNSNDVVKDIQKNKAYYIANAGLEMFYSALSKEAVTTCCLTCKIKNFNKQNQKKFILIFL